jgi:hypothetical protein
MMLSRRTLLLSSVGASAAAVGGCGLFTATTNPTTGAVTYGLSPAVVSFISSAVQQIASYLPAVESIAATAASLFGPAYATIVTAGSAAVNAVVQALTNLIPTAPAAASAKLSAKLKALATSATGQLVGYTKLGVPVFAQ